VIVPVTTAVMTHGELMGKLPQLLEAAHEHLAWMLERIGDAVVAAIGKYTE